MQRLKRFQAQTAEDAYAQIREEFGPEAVIVSTRTVHAPGLFGAPPREYVEVVARVSEEEIERRERHRARLAAAREEAAGHAGLEPLAFDEPDNTDADPDDVDLETAAPPFVNEMAGSGRIPAGVAGDDLIERLRRVAAEAAAPLEPDEPADDEPPPPADPGPFAAVNGAARDEPADPSLLRTIADQVTEMREILDRLALAEVDGRIDQGPPALHDARALLREQGVSEATAAKVLDAIAGAAARQGESEGIRRLLERKLAAQLPPVVRPDLSRRPAAIFLVGPAGAGKTTMALRLGLDLMRSHSLPVMVAGCDVNRAGAPQQLMAMAGASGVPARLCYAPGELQSMLEESRDGVVIVDMPGHNGTRRDRMAELSAFLQAAPRPAGRRSVLLTLPATMQADDLARAVEAYQSAGVDGLVLTRCDETRRFGALLSVAAESQTGVAYTAHGESIADAPRAGENLALARAVVAGAWPETPGARPRPLSAARPAAPAGGRTGR